MSRTLSATSASPLPKGDDGRYCFLVEWFDSQAALMRQYQLLYFTQDDTIEIYDIKARRTFLKRCSYPAVRLSDLYIGAQVSIYARQLKIVDYGDKFTKDKLAQQKGRSLALIKPSGYEKWGSILSCLLQSGYKLGRVRTARLSPNQAQQFYGDATVTPRAAELASGLVLALEVIGSGVQQALMEAARPNSAVPGRDQEARDLASALSAVHVASSERDAESELSFLFENSSIPTTATLTDCTLCLIKPHAIQQGTAGAIITSILHAGFDISAATLMLLDRSCAEEFMEVYKGVLPEYGLSVEQLCSGPTIALEIRAPPERLQAADGSQLTIVQAFRQLCGPSDPEIARHLRPHSLRARFGQSKIQNGVHCTDLDEDGVLESQYFFQIMQEHQAKIPTSSTLNGTNKFNGTASLGARR